MSRTCGDDAALEGTADKGEVTDEVEQLVACGLVLGGQGDVVDISELRYLLVLYTHQVGQTVEVGLCHGGVVDDDGVVEVAPLDEVVLHQGLNLAHEYKCAAGGNLSGILLDMLEGGELVVEDFGVEVNLDIDAEIVVGEYDYRRACLGI